MEILHRIDMLTILQRVDGELEHLKAWMSMLMQKGPNYGYYPEPQESFLVVAPEFKEKALASE